MTPKEVADIEDLKYYESLSEQGKLEYLDFVRSLHGGSLEPIQRIRRHDDRRVDNDSSNST